MKYLGNKTRLIDFIEMTLSKNKIKFSGINALDLCAGTGAVSAFFKSNNCNVTSIDIMNYSVGELYRVLYYNNQPSFYELEDEVGGSDLDSVVSYLNNLKPIKGYYYNEYSDGGSAGRKYFSGFNGEKIDAIMLCLKKWEKLLQYEKYMFLRGIVVNSIDRISNIAGTYGAYLKIWRSMALKPLVINKPEFINNGSSIIINGDIVNFLKNSNKYYDLIYLDPPYNNRQYAPNFHVLENLSNNDYPKLNGITGIIDYQDKKSNFCYKSNALLELENVVLYAKTNTFVLSYSNEGIMGEKDIVNILKKYFEKIVVERKIYRRFKTNSNTEAKTGLCELLFIARDRLSSIGG